jgi:CheY-like chemotaxis protein
MKHKCGRRAENGYHSEFGSEGNQMAAPSFVMKSAVDGGAFRFKRVVPSAGMGNFLFRYGLAVVSVVMALGGALLANRHHFRGVEFPFFLFAIALTVWYAGTGPGITALVLSSLAFDYFFTEPFYTLYVTRDDLSYYIAVMLLDLKLPKVNGFEVLERVRADENLKMIPVVILTSSHEERDPVKGYKLGVNAYVVKPVDFHQFVNAIKELGAFWAVINEPPPGSVKRK